MPVDRVTNMKQLLQQLPEPSLEQQCIANTEIANRYESLLFIRRIDVDGEWLLSSSSRVAAFLQRMVEEIPEDMVRQVQGLRPDQLAYVALLDCMHRSSTDESIFANRCLDALLQLAAAASIYPDKLRQAVKIAVHTSNEKYAEDNTNDDMPPVSDYIVKMRVLETALGQYMPHQKTYAVITLMLDMLGPPEYPAGYFKLDPVREHDKWAELIESFGMTEEMKEYTRQLQDKEEASPVRAHIIAQLHRYVDSNKKLGSMKRPLDEEPYHLAASLRMDWLDALAYENIVTRMANPDQKLAEFTDCAPDMLAAVLFLSASSFFRPKDLKFDFSLRKLRKGAETVVSEEAEAKTFDTPELQDWAEQQATIILEHALDRLAPMPATENGQWAAVIESLSMTEAIKRGVNREQVTAEIAAELHGYAQKASTKEKKKLQKMDDKDMTIFLFNKWLGQIDKARRVARRRQANETSINLVSQFNELPLNKLATLLVWAAASAYSPAELKEELKDQYIRGHSKTSTKGVQQVVIDQQSTAASPTDSPLHELSEWVEKQAEAIVSKGLDRLAAVFEEPEPLPEAPGIPQDFSARLRELKIREKALKLKEETFGRKVDDFNVRMKKFEEKYLDLDKKVENIEEKMDTE